MSDFATLQLTVSHMPTVSDKAPIAQRKSSWGELVSTIKHSREYRTKTIQPLFKLATFGGKRNPNGPTEGSFRWDGNVERVSGVIVEHDAEEITPERAADMLREHGVEGVIYTTASHGVVDPSEGKAGGPRWRAVLPLSQSYPAAEHARLVGLANALLGGSLSLESWTLSQFYYLGRVAGVEFTCIHVPGLACVDLLDLILEPLECVKHANGRNHGKVEADYGDAFGAPRITDLTYEQMVQALNCIPSDTERPVWVQDMAAWHHLTGGSGAGHEDAQAWSAKGGAKYTGSEAVDRVWDSLKLNRAGRIVTGRRILRRAAELGDWKNPASVAAQKAGKPVIQLVDGLLPEIAAQVEALLKPDVYSRGGSLIRIGRAAELNPKGIGPRRDAEQLVCVQVTAEWIQRAATERGNFQRHDARAKKMVAKDCPTTLANNILKQGAWPDFKPLIATAAAPFVRPDLSICEQPGYDEVSGIFYRPATDFPPVPAAPSKDDAAAALERLRAPFREFPYESPAAEAAAIAYIMTLVLRSGLPTSPVFFITAPLMAAGKSLFAKVANLLATGALAALYAWADDESELRKGLYAALLAGDTALIFDNLPNGSTIRSPQLCIFSTAETYKDRRLGVSETIALPNRCTVAVTGNNLTPAGDLSRRSVIVRLDPNMESARGRNFTIDDLAGHVRQRRPELLVAALTVVKSYVAADMPRITRPLESFEQWSRLVRDPLVWLGMPDPLLTQDAEAEDEVQPLRAAFGAIAAAVRGRDFTSQELAQVVCGIDSEGTRLSEALATAGCSGANDPKKIGYWLRSMRTRVAGPWKLLVAHDGENRKWSLRPV